MISSDNVAYYALFYTFSEFKSEPKTFNGSTFCFCPYFAIARLLKITNCVTIIKGEKVAQLTMVNKRALGYSQRSTEAKVETIDKGLTVEEFWFVF